MNKAKRKKTMMCSLRIMALFIIHCSLFISEAQAQVKLGLRGGLQLAQMEFNADALSSSNRVGFFIGPTLRITTHLLGVGVDVSALYDQRDLKVEDATVKQQSLVVPAHARLGATMFQKIGVFIFGGPQLRFNLGEDIKRWDEEESSKQFIMQNTTLGLNLGLGVIIGRIEGSLLYHIPFGKTGDFTWDNAKQQLQDETWNHATSTVNAWRLSVAYYF